MKLDTTNSAVLTGVIVTAGQWSEGKGLSIRVVTGAVVLGLGLAILSGISDDLARAFAMLILVVAALRYTVPIVKKTGLAK